MIIGYEPCVRILSRFHGLTNRELDPTAENRNTLDRVLSKDLRRGLITELVTELHVIADKFAASICRMYVGNAKCTMD